MDISHAVMDEVNQGVTGPSDERVPYDDEILMCGYLIKLGHRMKNWKHRWVVVRGNGCLQYFKQSPSATKPLVTLRPKGEIKLQRDCLELIRWERCNFIMKSRAEELGSTMFQSIKWPSNGNENSSFGIRTTYRTYLFVAPDGDANSWVQGLDKVCQRCDVYEGVDKINLKSASRRTGSEQAHRNSLLMAPRFSQIQHDENEDNDFTEHLFVSRSPDKKLSA
eukprot:gene10591-2714_t